ncbi:MAG: hypothetical protein ACRDJM_11160 [Actinomycetota bacterium]
MKRLVVLPVAVVALLGAFRMAAVAEGPIPDCLYFAEGTGAGLIPPTQERFVCELAVDEGRHLVLLGWTAGATASVTVDISGDDGVALYRLHCTVTAGLSACETASSVPFESADRWLVATGPFDAQRAATIELDRPATLTFTGGPVYVTPVLLGEGIFGLTVDEGNPINCLLLACEPEPTETATATPTSSPTGG